MAPMYTGFCCCCRLFLSPLLKLFDDDHHHLLLNLVVMNFFRIAMGTFYIYNMDEQKKNEWMNEWMDGNVIYPGFFKFLFIITFFFLFWIDWRDNDDHGWMIIMIVTFFLFIHPSMTTQFQKKNCGQFIVGIFF